jgi:hypothetical protein
MDVEDIFSGIILILLIKFAKILSEVLLTMESNNNNTTTNIEFHTAYDDDQFQQPSFTHNAGSSSNHCSANVRSPFHKINTNTFNVKAVITSTPVDRKITGVSCANSSPNLSAIQNSEDVQQAHLNCKFQRLDFLSPDTEQKYKNVMKNIIPKRKISRAIRI